MPCDQIRVQQVVFKAENLELLQKALERAGFQILASSDNYLSFRNKNTYRTGEFANNKLIIQEGIDVDAIKREYSKVSVEMSAKKFGWVVAKTADNKLRLKRAY